MSSSTGNREPKKIELVEGVLEKIGQFAMKISPISARCQAVIKEGAPCEDGYKVFTGQRRYAMCRTFDALEKGEGKSLGDGIRLGWAEVHKKCGL